VYCTDVDDAALELLTHAAVANGVDGLVRTARLEYGNALHAEELLRSIVEERAGQRDGTQPMPAEGYHHHEEAHPGLVVPGLVVASDLIYDLDAIGPIVETIVQLGAPPSLLAFTPRHLDADFGGGCEELERLVDHARKGARPARARACAPRRARPAVSSSSSSSSR
jgi:hypothetical protein